MNTNEKLFQDLMQENKRHINHYANSQIIQLIDSQTMVSKDARKKLLNCIQVFSNYFQKTVMLRATLTEQKSYFQVSWDHLVEEFGHNMSLLADRGNIEPDFDPILDGCSSWFAWKMFTLDNAGKTFLMHFVLESSANVFFQKAHKVMKAHNETAYFAIHSELDAEHEMMGAELLKHLSNAEYHELFTLQKQGWGMINAICDHIAYLVYSDVSISHLKSA